MTFSWFYLWRSLLILLCYQGTFLVFYPQTTRRQKLSLTLLLLPTLILIGLFGNYATIVWGIGVLLCLHGTRQQRLLVIDCLLLSFMLVTTCTLIAHELALPFIAPNDSRGLFDWLQVILFVILLGAALVILNHFKFQQKLLQHISVDTTLLIGYFCFSFLLLLICSELFHAYEQLLTGLLIFMIGQFILMVFLLLHISKQQRQQYENQLLQQQLATTQLYITELETSEQQLRQFKHDYQNILLSLQGLTDRSENAELQAYLAQLMTYSAQQIDSHTDLQNDLVNVKNPYLKNLLLNKLYQMRQNKIASQFECRHQLTELPLKIFDFLRLLGIFIDNASEAAQTTSQPKVQIEVNQTSTYCEWIITNTCQPSQASFGEMSQLGFSTKSNHAGLGLTNAFQISQQYPNVSIYCQQSETTFTVNLKIDPAEVAQ
ncbi:sensor histidine kinase [Lapidilactobacillus salsurivasis]